MLNENNAIEKIFKNNGFGMSEKLCLIALIHFADRKGRIEISLNDLSINLGCQRKTASTIIKKLTIKKAIITENNKNQDGGNAANTYILSDDFFAFA